MRALAAARREVYRLYDEEEFFALEGADALGAVTVDGGTVGGSTRESGSPRLRGIAGTTAVLAALGAAGGAVALARLAPFAGARRPFVRGLLAEEGPSAALRAARQDERPRPRQALPRLRTRGEAAARGRSGRGVAAHGAGRGPSASSSLMDHRRTVAAAVPSGSAAVDASATSSAAPPPAVPTAAASPAAPAAAEPPAASRAEFGFER